MGNEVVIIVGADITLQRCHMDIEEICDELCGANQVGIELREDGIGTTTADVETEVRSQGCQPSSDIIVVRLRSNRHLRGIVTRLGKNPNTGEDKCYDPNLKEATLVAP